MPRLSEHWEGDFLEVGDHLVSVASYKNFECNSGSPGVEFILRTGNKTTKASFVLHPNAVWKLAKFAKACGLTKEQSQLYDTDNVTSHQMLIGKAVMIRIVKGEKYHEVDDFWLRAGDAIPPAPTTTDGGCEPFDPDKVAPVAEEDDDDVPF